ncbi:MAG: discoidin domain-containing protein, partial [Clostridia bacterium]|nr:discoidin domain-containing protein [Clostridia bacterium]
DAAKLVDGAKSGAIARIIPESYTGNDGLSIALPDGNVASAATGNGNDWFIVDLGRRYEVSSLVLHPRTDVMADAHMQGFVIEAANTPSFTDKVTLGSVKNGDSTVDGTTALTFPGNGGAYRYIRLRKTANTYHGYSELEVFANVTVTNVARGASTEVRTKYLNYDGRYTVDGNTTSSSNAWRVSTAPGVDYTPNNLVIDLGEDYPLEMAGLYTYHGTAAYNKNFTAYGYSAAAGKPAVSTDNTGATAKLFSTGSGTGKKYVSYGFNQGHYRYFVLSKTVNEFLFLVEAEAYVVNPAAYSVDINDDNKLTVHFSDKMEASTLTPENFTIEGVTLSNPVTESGYNGGYDVTFSYSGEIVSGMELVISETVRNQNGIEMAEDAVLPLDVDIFTVTRNGAAVGSLLAGSSHAVTAKFIAEENATAVMFAAIKQADGALVSCAMSEDTQMTTGNAASFTIEGLVPKSGEKLYVYIWEKSTLKPLLDNLEVQ